MIRRLKEHLGMDMTAARALGTDHGDHGAGFDRFASPSYEI